jgi:hypothetical protein
LNAPLQGDILSGTIGFKGDCSHMGNRLEGKRIAIFIEEGFDDDEFIQPAEYLRAAGASVVIVGSGRQNTFTGKRGMVTTPDTIATNIKVADFDAFVIPGGRAPEKMRLCKPMIDLIAKADDRGKTGPPDNLHGHHSDRRTKCRRELRSGIHRGGRQFNHLSQCRRYPLV